MKCNACAGTGHKVTLLDTGAPLFDKSAKCEKCEGTGEHVAAVLMLGPAPASAPLARPGRLVRIDYDLTDQTMIRDAFLNLPETFDERVSLLKCVRGEVVEGTTQRGVAIEHGDELERLGLVYSNTPGLWRPTMRGIYAGRSLVARHEDLTKPGASSPPSMVKRLHPSEVYDPNRRRPPPAPDSEPARALPPARKKPTKRTIQTATSGKLLDRWVIVQIMGVDKRRPRQ